MDLDALWADAAQAERLHPQRGAMKNASPEPIRKATRETWTLPENWKATRVITLLHEESRSVIGNFQEFVHKTYSRDATHARRLQLVDGPTVSTGIEYIRGWDFLSEDTRERLQFIPEKWTSEREVLLPDLLLEHLGVHAADVLLQVFLYQGLMQRAELREAVRFSSPEGRMIITLPKGTNVLEVMGLGAKVELRKELSA